ncbi:MAG: Asp-tRNA(Asn)/Glu-tRNA(Gln) amidotransferase subunit GatA [Campylobacteraceae bacterium]|jgi:aspartyl-tRNA(Asn)/glutamyl-tRNA(Gln) amidotransferase subunit A|nr:Asp-tRNA(Asn)/Glu-tRNA(Gln) amidotransferase subunit GatA [Campylobacteraceae bacterium]
MISFKDALKLGGEDLKGLKQDLKKKIEETKEINAYVGFEEAGEGVPVLVKDNINVKGWEITCASNILKGYVSPYNATAIEKLLQNGCSLFGRSNMDEFAMGSTTESSVYGRTLNPHNKLRVPGGSSGGSAAAVANGSAIVALGSDTGGSIRQPAALCGCVGMKPTYGRVSRYGLVAYGSSLDQIGSFGRSVEDVALLYDKIAGFDPKDSTSANIEHITTADKIDKNRKLTFAVIENYVEQASEDIRESIKNVIKELEKAGHKVIYKNLLNSKYDVAAYYVTATAEAATNLQRFDGVRYGYRAESKSVAEMFVKTRSEGFGSEVQRRILLGNFVLSSGYYDAYYVKAQKAREFIKNEYLSIFKEADIVIMPVTPSTAFEFNSFKEPLEMYLEDIYTISVNLAGLPGISVPTGYDKQKLPIGVQLLASHFEEQKLFDAASIVEDICAYKNNLI